MCLLPNKCPEVNPGFNVVGGHKLEQVVVYHVHNMNFCSTVLSKFSYQDNLLKTKREKHKKVNRQRINKAVKKTMKN